MQQRIDLNGECVIWTRAKNDKGYGQRGHGGKVVYAHRLAYERANGPIPAGFVIDHLCRTPLCVNPDHLEAVTHTENVRRGLAAKITMADAEHIRELSKTISQQAIRKIYPLHHSCISRIVNYKSWRPERNAA